MGAPESPVVLAQPKTRFQRQREIENLILSFRPDLEAAMEILDALQAAIQRRYEEHELDDCESAYKEYRAALDELDTMLGPSDPH